jgi:hypothetical protein
MKTTESALQALKRSQILANVARLKSNPSQKLSAAAFFRNL